MDLKHIEAFIVTFEEGSMNRGAQRLGIPQPTMSTLTRDLEHELKTQLFDRQARGTKPTDQARTLYPHLQRVLADVAVARMSVADGLDQPAGLMRAGLGPSVTRGLLPRVLPVYLERYPRVDVVITEAFSGALTDWMLAGELDFCVVAVPPADRRVLGRRLKIDPIVMISGPAFCHRHLEACDLRSERGLKVVLPWSKMSVRRVLDTFIDSGQIATARTIQIDSVSTILDFVATTDWVTFLPLTTVCRDLDGKRLIIQPLSEPEITNEFYLVHPARRTLSPASRAFAELIEQEFLAVARQWTELLAKRTAAPL